MLNRFWKLNCKKKEEKKHPTSWCWGTMREKRAWLEGLGEGVGLGDPQCCWWLDWGTPSPQSASGRCGRALQALSSKAAPAASPALPGLRSCSSRSSRGTGGALPALPLPAPPGRILSLPAAVVKDFSWDGALCTLMCTEQSWVFLQSSFTAKKRELRAANSTQHTTQTWQKMMGQVIHPSK